MTPQFPRRWFRFSLRSLLVVTVLFALPMGWIAKERTQSGRERELAKHLSQNPVWQFEFAGPYVSREAPDDTVFLLQRRFDTFADSEAWWRRWARQITGSRAVGFMLSGQHGDLSPLVNFTQLRSIHLVGTDVSDLAPLARLTHLESLYIADSPVRDLTPLAELKNLKSISASHTQVGDLTPLFGLEHLRSFQIRISPVSKAQVDALKRALPNCQIEHDR